MIIDKKVTINDIAEACGVSRWTVSAVLFPTEKNRHIGASEATRRKIREVAERWNYRVHRASRQLVKQRHGSLGVLVQNMFAIPWHSMSGMMDQASTHDLLTVIERVPDERTSLPTLLRELAVDGLLAYEDLGEDMDAAIHRAGLPMVYINANVHNRHAGIVNIDEAGMMQRAGEIFGERGRNKILFLSARHDSFFKIRQTALARFCTSNAWPEPVVEVIEACERPFATTARVDMDARIREILTRHPDVEAILTASDEILVSLTRVGPQLNRCIPRDISVLHIYNNPIANHLEPLISCLHVDYNQMARFGVERLYEMIESNGPIPAPIVLPYQYIERESV